MLFKNSLNNAYDAPADENYTIADNGPQNSFHSRGEIFGVSLSEHYFECSPYYHNHGNRRAYHSKPVYYRVYEFNNVPGLKRVLKLYRHGARRKRQKS